MYLLCDIEIFFLLSINCIPCNIENICNIPIRFRCIHTADMYVRVMIQYTINPAVSYIWKKMYIAERKFF